MSGTILVGSLGVVAALLCFFFWKLGSEENGGSKYPLQIIIFAFILGVVVLLGKVAVDYEDNCSWLVTNSTTVGSTSTYQYSYECSENPNSTASTFYGVTVWISRLTAAYLILSFGFEVIGYFRGKKRGEQ